MMPRADTTFLRCGGRRAFDVLDVDSRMLAHFAGALALQCLPNASFGACGNRLSRHPSCTEVWFLAMWHITSQKNGMSALGLQRALGLGSYKTAWLILHKLRQAMVGPGRERLRGVVEVDETYWGAAESGGATGRLIYSKALIVVAAEQDGKGIGRIRMARIPDFDRATLHGFIRSSVEPGSTVCTDGLNSYRELEGYIHHRQVQRSLKDVDHLLPRVHRAVSLLKRWMLGTHQGAIGHQHLDDYLNEFVFRFNRRKSASRGKLFFRLAQQAVPIAPTTYERLVRPQDVG